LPELIDQAFRSNYVKNLPMGLVLNLGEDDPDLTIFCARGGKTSHVRLRGGSDVRGESKTRLVKRSTSQ
jgi:hypothetical protein